MGAWSHLGPNTLGHYNPYKNFAHQRSVKALMSGKDAESNAKRQLYESKMDKQRLEHILFSGDPSGPLDQQKERMRQTLKRRQESQLKKEDPSASRGILKGGIALSCDRARPRSNGTNAGFFLTEHRPQQNNVKPS